MADSKISALTDGSPSQATDELPVSRTAGVATRKVTSQSIADLKTWTNLSGKPSTFPPSFHATSHQDGGADEISVAGLSGLLADAQKVTVRKNAGADVGTRKRLNFIEGTNVTLTVADDAGGDEVDITIAASGSGGGAPTDAEYLVGSANAGLSAERVVTDTATVAWDLATGGQAKANVPDNAITYAKMQDVSAASKLLGRGDSGSGDPQEITLGSGLSMSGTTLSASGGGGGGPTHGVVTADVTVTNSTTLVDMTGALIAIGSSSTERWLFQLLVLQVANNAAPDMKIGWTFPSGCTMLWAPHTQGAGSIGAVNWYWDNMLTGASTPAAIMVQTATHSTATLNGVVTGVIYWGIIFGGGTSGNVQAQFANATAASGQSCTVKEGSVLTGWKIRS